MSQHLVTHTDASSGQTTDIDNMVGQATADTLAEMIALDTLTRNYHSGTIGFVTGAGQAEQGNSYVLCRESTDTPNGTTIVAAVRSGNWILLGSQNFPAATALFAAGSHNNGDAALTAFGPNGKAGLTTAGSGVAFVAPKSGTLKNLRFSIRSATGGLNTAVGATDITVYVNGVATGITTSLPAGNADTEVTDLTHTAPVVAGDQVNLVVDFSQLGGGALSNFSISAELV